MTTNRTAKSRPAALLAEHAGHEVVVLGGVVTCLDHADRVVLDDSGARPGLVAANQSR